MMKRRMMTLLTTGLAMVYATAVWAGSGAGGGPAGDEGGGGAEPTLIALIVLSMIPGIYFVRKAMTTKPVRVDD